MRFLTVEMPDGTTVQQELDRGVVRIGRSSINDIVLSDPEVSRTHAEIRRGPEGLLLLDLGSRNGTYLNENRVTEPVILHAGDTVRLGKNRFTLDPGRTQSVEFDEKPLDRGLDTTFLSIEDLRTPPPDTISPIPIHPSPRKDGALPASKSDATQPPPPSRSRGLPDIISQAERELVFHRPLKEICERVMDLADQVIAYEHGVLLVLDEKGHAVETVRVRGEQGQTFSVSRTIINDVLTTRRSVLMRDALSDERFHAGTSIGQQRIRSVMCVPLRKNGDVMGCIYVDSRVAPGVFTEEHLRALSFLANVAAVKIENARLFEESVEHRKLLKDLRYAALIQRGLLPLEAPRIPGYLLDGTNCPSSQVGGDCYDYLVLAEGRCGLLLGDVAGHGLPAALLMCNFHGSLRALSELGLPLDKTMAHLNRLLCRCVPENRFVAGFLGILDPASHTLSYINAGHAPPWIVRNGSPPERLNIHCLPLGVRKDLAFRPDAVRLGVGDILVCYSDGITETESPGGEMFGDGRLVDVVTGARGEPPREILEKLLAAVDEHRGREPQQDDITLVIAKRTS